MTCSRSSLIAMLLAMATASAFGQQISTQRPAEAAIAASVTQPMVSNASISKATVVDVHLRPLFITTIRTPEAVSSIAIGAPTLFAAEHSDQEPRLVYVKPSTKNPAESNLVITMQSGETISMRLISEGSSAASTPVDYIINYKPMQSFFVGSTDDLIKMAQESHEPSAKVKDVDPLDTMLAGQSHVSTPNWQSGASLDEKAKKSEPPSIVGALGEIRQSSGKMLVAYSVRNQSGHWVEVLPPQVEMSSPGNKDATKKKDRKRIVEAEQIAVDDYRVNGRRLAPGQRIDGVVQFERPGFKQSQERLLLQIASANSVDKPLLLSIPFVASGR
jgi:hypothetical protein